MTTIKIVIQTALSCQVKKKPHWRWGQIKIDMTNNKLKKALVASVDFGDTKIEGLQMPDGTYGVTARQANDILQFSTHPTHISRTVKRSLGKDYRLTRLSTELTNNPQLVLTLEQFEMLVKVLAKKGNQDAIQFALDTMGVSLRQRFADAFGEKFEKEEREKWIKQRSSHKVGYKPRFTCFLKQDDPNRKDYGKQMNIFKSKIGLRRDSVNEYDLDELDHLNRYEFAYQALRNSGFDHYGAVQELNSLHLEEIKSYGDQTQIDLNF